MEKISEFLGNLNRYNSEIAKVGDSVIIITKQYGKITSIKKDIIKSVSAKRGDISFKNDSTRFDKYGDVLGKSAFSMSFTGLYQDDEAFQKFYKERKLRKSAISLLEGLKTQVSNMEFADLETLSIFLTDFVKSIRKREMS